MIELAARVSNSFRKTWSTTPDVVSIAPGRVNLIGEHTDYTGGFVLPAAIDRHIVVAAKRTNGSKVTGYSVDFDNIANCPVGEYDPEHPVEWFHYVAGVLSELERTGHFVPGFCFSVGGDIPIGAGLSSSAALEMAVLTALEGLLGIRMDDREAALLCQRAENDFVGMNCGIMDQLISRMGQRDHALLIDCTSLSVEPVDANLPGYSWLVIDSGKRRGLVDSEYNQRRSECEQALAVARTLFPNREIRNLRDVSSDALPALRQVCDDKVYRRLRHVITENERVLKTVDALRRRDAETVGRLLYQSHESLRDDFEVSCKELDSTVETLSQTPGVSGARLTGAGFGGAVVALARTNTIPVIAKAIKETGAQVFSIKIDDGVRLLEVHR
ncbi:MAG TPA: galactokinase [Dehalococcoidia bacterium]|nr:galactokinase [Dehalococcoidia bacterium]